MMSTPTVAAPALALRARQEEEVDRYEAVKQYSGGQIAALWAAAAGPDVDSRLDRRAVAEPSPRDQRATWDSPPNLLQRGAPLDPRLDAGHGSAGARGAWMGAPSRRPLAPRPAGSENRPRRRQGVVVAGAVRAPFSCLGGAADQSHRTAAEGLPQLHRRRRGSRRPLLPRGLGVVRAFGPASSSWRQSSRSCSSAGSCYPECRRSAAGSTGS